MTQTYPFNKGSPKISPTFGDFSPTLEYLFPTFGRFVAGGSLSLHFCRKANHFYGFKKRT
nr:MAG TPA: hypothetical protein [Caudoviricetes sp.]